MNLFDDKVGLCKSCGNARVINNDRGSTFYLCALAEKNPRFPKYPRLPVWACEGYVPISDSAALKHSISKRDE